METCYKKMPHKYRVFLDVSPRGSISLRIQKREEELTIFELLATPGKVKQCAEHTPEKFILEIFAKNELFRKIELEFESGAISDIDKEGNATHYSL